MRKLFYKMSLFYKYFASNFLILVMPVIFIFLLIFNYFGSILKNDTIRNNQNMLTQVMEIIDTQLQKMIEISAKVSSEAYLSSYYLTKNSYGAMNGITELSKYMSANDFIYNMIYYIRGSDSLYSPYGTYTMHTYTSIINKYENWDTEDIINVLNNVKTPFFRPSEEVTYIQYSQTDKNKFVTYIVPIPLYNTQPFGTLLFQIKEEALKGLIKNILKEYDGNTVILDNKYNVIISLKDEAYLKSPKFSDTIRLENNIGSKSITLDNIQYLFSYVKSDKSNWSYITLVPVNEIMKNVSGIKTKAVYALIVLMLISCSLIYFLTMFDYNPIKRLKEFTDEKLGKNTGSINEIDSIKLAVDDITNINKDLYIKVENSKLALREFLLSNLLKGRIYNIEDFNNKGDDIGLAFSYHYYFVALIYVHSMDIFESLDKGILISELEKVLPDGLQGYATDSVDSKTITFIFASNQSDISFIEENIGRLHDYIHREFCIQATVGIGNSYLKPEQMGKSFLEAATAIEYRFIKGTDKIITFKDISGQADVFKYYPDKQLNLLNYALKTGDTQKIADTLGGIFRLIRENNLPLFMARCLYYDIINTIIKAMHEINMEFPENKGKYPDVNSLMEFETLEQLTETVNRTCFDICDFIKKNRKNSNFDLKNKIIEYIRQNYHKTNFSFQSMSDDLGISISYISRYFKEQTGQTVLDYVNYLRIDHAKQLLETTDEPIENVIKSIGYFDVSSFIRKFKKDMGITPGEYRKIHRA